MRTSPTLYDINNINMAMTVRWMILLFFPAWVSNVYFNCIVQDSLYHNMDVIGYPLFADADTGIYPHAASQYHARPKANRGIVVIKCG